MASSEQAQSLAEEAICPICRDFFCDPVILECGHNFCRSCITQCWEKKEKNSCPECREEFPERNVRVLASPAEKARKFTLNPKEKENKLHCEEHQEELKLFCKTDKKLICLICRNAREHREHHFMPIKEAVGIYKEQLKSSLDSLTEKKSAVLEIERQQKQKISEIKQQSSSQQTHITSEFTKMHEILIEKEQRLIRDLREQEEKILEPMEENLRHIQENLNSTQEKLVKLQKQMDQKDGLIFLKEQTRQKRRISDDGYLLTLADAALSMEKFDGPLLFTVWREIMDIINPVTVTLDVETANPELEVSDDRKSVRWTGTQRNPHDTKKRFTDWACVLGSEGFTSGRHYWEVEVVGNQWCSLGVAAESVGRKGWVTLSPANGLWTIGRFGDQFDVNSSPPSPLPDGSIPGKVGVYLSYESGTVSFYSADTKSHLHTFTGNKFTEKLYPFFWTWDENKWLRICSGSNPGL
uniref:nuclear factor 7, ovary-like n=1 Tax=Pristiophorus japonicus TaxID=55135 RepID=UPI00398F8C35